MPPNVTLTYEHKMKGWSKPFQRKLQLNAGHIQIQDKKIKNMKDLALYMCGYTKLVRLQFSVSYLPSNATSMIDEILYDHVKKLTLQVDASFENVYDYLLFGECAGYDVDYVIEHYGRDNPDTIDETYVNISFLCRKPATTYADRIPRVINNVVPVIFTRHEPGPNIGQPQPTASFTRDAGHGSPVEMI